MSPWHETELLHALMSKENERYPRQARSKPAPASSETDRTVGTHDSGAWCASRTPPRAHMYA
jgi:hypothetical protein